MKRILPYFRRALLLVLVLALFFTLTAVFERKTLEGSWNYTTKVKGFFNEPQHSFDVLAFGSSHMYCTLNPLCLYEERGITSYVLATQQQPVELTYHYVKEALKVQSPKVVLLETYMYTLSDFVPTEGVIHDAIDSFPNTPAKLEMIRDVLTETDKWEFALTFLKYHTRWKELTKADYKTRPDSLHDPYRGYVFIKEAAPNENGAVDDSALAENPLSEHNQYWLDKTVELIRSHGATPVLLFAPANTSESVNATVKYLHAYAEENNLTFLDLNREYDAVGLNNQTDFCDSSHLNVYGAERATLYLADTLGLSASTPMGDAALWEEDLLFYHTQKDPVG